MWLRIEEFFAEKKFKDKNGKTAVRKNGNNVKHIVSNKRNVAPNQHIV